VEVNGCKAAAQHYGYAPFYSDLTGLAAFGEANRITVHVNTSMQPNSRWYTGSGLYRGVRLLHGPKVYIAPDGIFVYTKEVSDGWAFLETETEIRNETAENRLVEAEIRLIREDTGETVAASKRVVQVNARGSGTARIAINVPNPLLWDAEDPNLYRVAARVTNVGRFRTHFEKDEAETTDEAETLFGIRTITADSVRGLRINGKTVKLKGGCLHHDNGLLGSVSLYETEAREIRKLKESGFNAIRTAHNPPSAALIEACDRLGMYVFDEAFDAWGIAKRSGDYSQFFAEDWEKDLTAFVRRDRSHPSVILWSTGNEIPERGGLNNGYALAEKLAETIRDLDGTRPISNGICSFWCGLDDALARGMNQAQNAGNEGMENLWEKGTEPFTNGLDIIGYNYMEDLYEKDHEMFPERVILGSENFPKEIGFRWPLVEKLDYVIGDFTWTAWDYLGEAGIGKAVSLAEGDPLLEKGPWALMPQNSSPFPWRTANDADFDITGRRTPQGDYRSVIWGNRETFLYSYPPEAYGKTELISPWGFPAVLSNWNYAGAEGKPLELVVFSGAEEVEVLVNGQSIGRETVGRERPLPCSVRFETAYAPGTVEAISYTDGQEVSRAVLKTPGPAAQIRLLPEKTTVKADGHDLIYVGIEIVDQNGVVCPDAAVPLTAEVSGAVALAGFGSGNPVTDEDYTDHCTVTFHGRAMAILRAGYEKGKIGLKVSGEGLPEAETVLTAE
jgi:beta-galactosidase